VAARVTWRRLVLVVAALGGAVAVILWDQLARVSETAVFDNPEEHYKYGGLSLEPGFPYYVWAVMPEVFADLLPRPGGWEVFGFVDEGRGYPVGFAKQTVGYPGLTPNCALCHTGAYRPAEGAAPVPVPAAPASALDFGAFRRFLFEAAADDRFSSAVLLDAIERRFELGVVESLVYRTVLIPMLRRSLLEQRAAAAWTESRPDPGRGRFDAFNLLKIEVLGMEDDGSVATSDYPPLWNHAARRGLRLHWNGGSDDLEQEDLMSVYSLNRGVAGFAAASFERVRDYIATRPAPAYPFSVDSTLAAAGAEVFAAACGACHAEGGERFGQVTAQAEVGTDPEFLSMWSEAFVERLRSIDEGPFRFPDLRVTDGYVNVPLDGLWLRAPYLHNGSVPTLAHLLSPAAERPTRFARGRLEYDSVRVGFAWQPEGDPAPEGVSWTLYDVSLPGNGNQGHEYGVTLPGDQKRALMEFLKTR